MNNELEVNDEPPDTKDRGPVQLSRPSGLSHRLMRSLLIRSLPMVFVCHSIGSKPSPRLCYSPGLYQDDEGNHKKGGETVKH